MDSASDPLGLLAQPQPNITQGDQLNQDVLGSSQPQMPTLNAPPKGGRIKQLLSNFFQGAGDAMTHAAGLPTQYDLEKQRFNQQLQLANAQSLAGIRSAQEQQYQYTPVQMPDGSSVNVMNRDVGKVISAQQRSQATQAIGALNAKMKALGLGYQINPDTQDLEPIAKEDLSAIQQANLQGKTPNEIGLIMRAQAGDTEAQKTLSTLQQNKKDVAVARGTGFALGRAQYTPFETVLPGTNTPTTISNLQALKTGAPKVPLGTQSKLGGQYALFNDAYGILNKIDTLADKVNLDDPNVSGRVTAGYAAIKDPAAQGLAGEVLSNYLARQPINQRLTPDERELVLTMAQGKAAGTGLRSIMGQAGTNELQQRLDSALFPGGQAAGNRATVKQQTAATRQLLNRFSVGQPQVGLNAPGSPTALQSQAEPQRPSNVPPGFVFKENGPKGRGWYRQ